TASCRPRRLLTSLDREQQDRTVRHSIFRFQALSFRRCPAKVACHFSEWMLSAERHRKHMASYSATERRQDSGGTSLLYDPRIRGIFYQVIVFGVVIGAIYWIVGNTVTNLQRANIASGFGFLSGRAGFDISQTLIQYSSD